MAIKKKSFIFLLENEFGGRKKITILAKGLAHATSKAKLEAGDMKIIARGNNRFSPEGWLRYRQSVDRPGIASL